MPEEATPPPDSDTIDFRAMLRQARERPGMYLMPEPWHARTVIPWLIGCDAATGYQLLGQEFSIWLSVRRGGPPRSPWAWYAQVMFTALPGRDTDYWNLSDEENDSYLSATFTLVDASLAEKGSTFAVVRVTE